MPVVSDEVCQETAGFSLGDEPSEMCAGYVEGGRNSCQARRALRAVVVWFVPARSLASDSQVVRLESNVNRLRSSARATAVGQSLLQAKTRARATSRPASSRGASAAPKRATMACASAAARRFLWFAPCARDVS